MKLCRQDTQPLQTLSPTLPGSSTSNLRWCPDNWTYHWYCLTSLWKYLMMLTFSLSCFSLGLLYPQGHSWDHFLRAAIIQHSECEPPTQRWDLQDSFCGHFNFEGNPNFSSKFRWLLSQKIRGQQEIRTWNITRILPFWMPRKYKPLLSQKQKPCWHFNLKMEVFTTIVFPKSRRLTFHFGRLCPGPLFVTHRNLASSFCLVVICIVEG